MSGAGPQQERLPQKALWEERMHADQDAGGRVGAKRPAATADPKGTHLPAPPAAKTRKHSVCEHNRQRSRCRDCGGIAVCPHGREARRCRDCGGVDLCEHLREKHRCKDCHPGRPLPGNCEHNRRKSLCKECGGAGICEHNRIRTRCTECGGPAICEHKRIRIECKQCPPPKFCEHNRREGRCGQCYVARVKAQQAQAARAGHTAGQKPAARGRLTPERANVVSQIERLRKPGTDRPHKDADRHVGAKRPAAAGPEDADRAIKQHRGGGAASGQAAPPAAKMPARKRSVCAHNRQRSRCRDCGGIGVCPHGREVRRCRDCGGVDLCEHLREKHRCKDCHPGRPLPGNCEHNRRKSLCKECGGAGICEHNRIRTRCTECGGAAICEHKRIRRECSQCLRVRALQQAAVELQAAGVNVCQHRPQRKECGECWALYGTARAQQHLEAKARLGSPVLAKFVQNVAICAPSSTSEPVSSKVSKSAKGTSAPWKAPIPPSQSSGGQLTVKYGVTSKE